MATSRINYKNWAVDASGNVVGGARIEIQYLYSGALVPAASIYTAETGSTTKATNPFTADADGSFSVWLAPGAYTFTLGTGAAQMTQSVYLVPADVEFTTRALIVTAIAAGASWPDGTILSAQGVRWEWSTGATAIADMPGALPAGQISLRHFTSAAADGTTSITAALQAAIDYAGGTTPGAFSIPGNSNAVYIPPGLWLWDDHDADGIFNIVRKPITFWSDGPNTGTLVCNTTDETGFFVQPPESGLNTIASGITATDINLEGLTLWNTTNTPGPQGGRSPDFTADCIAIQYDRSVGEIRNCLFRNWGVDVDLLGVPENMRIINSVFVNGLIAVPDAVMIPDTACVRIRVREVSSSATTGAKYDDGTGTWHAYANSVFIDNSNLEPGSATNIDRKEAAIICEGVDGLWVTNSHVAWGKKACVIYQGRHNTTPMTNVQFSNNLIDPLPGKSEHGILYRYAYSNTSTPASDHEYSNNSVAGCTAEGVYVGVDISGFTWTGGAFKGIGTTAGAGMRFSGNPTGINISDVTFRTVGASASDPCIWFEQVSRASVRGIKGDGATYGLVKVSSGCVDVTIGDVAVVASGILGGTTIEVPAGSAQVKVGGLSHIAESTSITAASSITLPAGADEFAITGATPITTLASASRWVGRKFTLRMDASGSITSGAVGSTTAGQFVLRNGFNFRANAAGDTIQFLVDANNVAREIGRGSISPNQVVIADDGVAVIPLPINYGYLSVAGNSSANACALFRFRANSGTESTTTVQAGTLVDFVTTTLSGTTGTDARMTIGINAGTLYIENRLGASVAFTYSLM